jgi:hypothetical protein
MESNQRVTPKVNLPRPGSGEIQPALVLSFHYVAESSPQGRMTEGRQSIINEIDSSPPLIKN